MKRIHRLRLIPLALVALVAALPAAVSHASPVAAPSHTHQSAKVTIRFAHFLGPAELRLVRKTVLAAYYKEYPNATVAFEPIPDTRVKAVTEIAAGTAADVFNLGDGDVGWYEAKGALVDLAPYAARSHFSFAQYVPATLILGHVGSHQYSLPKDYTSLAIYYNKDMFKAAGVPFPSNNWTWNDFERDAIKLNRPSAGVWGAWLLGDWPREVDAVVRAFGGRLDSPDGKRVEGYMDSPAAVRAIQFWVNLITKDKISPTPSQAAALNIGDLFASQKAAMFMSGIWPSLGDTGYPKTLKFHWGVAPLPRATVEANTICYAGFAMAKSTKHPNEAWGLIKYMSGPVGDTIWATINGLPAVKSIADKTGATRDPVTSAFLNGINFASLPDDTNGPVAPAAVGDTLHEGLDLLLNTPGTSVAQVLKIEARKGQAAISAYYSG